METHQNSQRISSDTSSTFAEKAYRNMVVNNGFNEIKDTVQKTFRRRVRNNGVGI